jgi:hypothetical protein
MTGAVFDTELSRLRTRSLYVTTERVRSLLAAVMVISALSPTSALVGVPLSVPVLASNCVQSGCPPME